MMPYINSWLVFAIWIKRAGWTGAFKVNEEAGGILAMMTVS